MTSSRARGVGLRVLLTLLVCAGGARAEEGSTDAARARAREKVREGGALYHKKDFAAALARYEEAYDLVASPKILFNLGLVYQALGRNADAADAFERFLAEATDVPPAARKDALAVHTALSRRLGRIAVFVGRPGVLVGVDGRPRGTTPLARPLFVEPGLRTVTIEGPDGRPAVTKEVTARAGETVQVVVELPAAPPPQTTAAEASSAPPSPPPPALPSVAPAPPQPPPSVAPASPSAAPPPGARGAVPPLAAAPAPAPLAARPSVRTSAADEPGPSAWRGRAIWVTGAAAGIALASGGVLQWIGSRRADAFNHTVAPNPAMKCDRILPDHGGGECRSLSGAFDRYRRLALFGYGAGGALAAGAALLYLTRPAEPPVGARRTLACAAVPPGGVGCVVGF